MDRHQAAGALAEAVAPLTRLRQDLAHNLVRNVRTGQTALSPAVLHEDVSFYRDPARFEAERQRFFRRMPLVACLSAELPRAEATETPEPEDDISALDALEDFGAAEPAEEELPSDFNLDELAGGDEQRQDQA